MVYFMTGMEMWCAQDLKFLIDDMTFEYWQSDKPWLEWFFASLQGCRCTLFASYILLQSCIRFLYLHCNLCLFKYTYKQIHHPHTNYFQSKCTKNKNRKAIFLSVKNGRLQFCIWLKVNLPATMGGQYIKFKTWDTNY